MTTIEHIREKTDRGWGILTPAIITTIILVLNTIYTAGGKANDLRNLQSDIVALKTVEPRLTNAMINGDNTITGRIGSLNTDVAVLQAQRIEDRNQRLEDHDRLKRIEMILNKLIQQEK